MSLFVKYVLGFNPHLKSDISGRDISTLVKIKSVRRKEPEEVSAL